MALANRTTRGDLREAGDGRKLSPQGFPLVSSLIGALAFVVLMLALWMVFFYAPMDALQGRVQRIFYLHIAMAWIGMGAFVVLSVAGIVCLITRDERWDWLARASAEIGAVCITLALITGSLWARPVWGTWWAWDPKLTATLILWFMYIGYIMLRNYMGRTSESARAGAVLAIVGVVDVPIIYLSVEWWRGLHPTAQVAGGSLPPEALLTMAVMLVAATLLFSFLMIQVYQLQKLQTLAQRLRASIE